MGLAREYLIEGRTEPFVQAYHDYQIDLAMMMGATREAAETQMAEALDFETKLAGVLMNTLKFNMNQQIVFFDRFLSVVKTEEMPKLYII